MLGCSRVKKLRDRVFKGLDVKGLGCLRVRILGCFRVRGCLGDRISEGEGVRVRQSVFGVHTLDGRSSTLNKVR